jgi:amino acid permease
MDIRRGSSASSGVVRSHSATVADADLARMGYKSELPRNLSMLSVLGLSFAIMAVPYGLSTTMYITLVDGQSVTILWGWVLISLISVSIAASLAEICAVYPTAGGKFIEQRPKLDPTNSFFKAYIIGVP